MTPPLCIVVKGFPRISETFITRELEALQDKGVTFALASLRRAAGDARLAAGHRVRGKVRYLPEYLHEEPRRAFQAVLDARKREGFAKAWAMFRSDLARDFTRNRVRRFGQACVLAAELPEGIRHIHAHFAHTPGSVARYAAAIRGLTFSLSAHAKDIWTTPDWDLQEKLKDARFCAVCNEAGWNRLSALANGGAVHLWPHAVAIREDVGRLPRAANAPIRLLTVARAVPKKGLDLLLDALERLPPDPAWTWTHIGGGDGTPALEKRVASHRYGGRMMLMGAQSHEQVLSALPRHEIFVLPSQIAADGDRDGRPNALLEAMAAGLACVAMDAGGVAETIRHEESGLLAANAPDALAAAMARLIGDAGLSLQLGRAAQDRAAALARDGERSLDALALALREASGQ
jgi:glycosyltransferase involved in cell wall biosynthesis